MFSSLRLILGHPISGRAMGIGKLRMCVFDLDDTIRLDRRPIDPSVAERIREVGRHVEVSLISGKDTAYVLGIADGMGLSVSYAVGEVGGVILQPGTHRQHVFHVGVDEWRALKNCERRLKRAFGKRIWFQPNLVNVTMLPLGGLDPFDVLSFAQGVIEEQGSRLYASTHSGMVDVMPIGLDKGIFIDHLESVGYAKNSLIAVGDGENDVPMLRRSGLSITFESSLSMVRSAADVTVRDIDGALDVIQEVVRRTA